MQNRTGLIILTLVCIGLAAGLVAVRWRSSETHRQDTSHIEALSNYWKETAANLDEQKQVSAMLQKDLDGQKQAFQALTNDFTQVSSSLTETRTTLTSTENSLKNTQEELNKRNARITELETQNAALDKQANDLSLAITNLTTQINETRRRLAASEGDKATLEKELKRLMGEKADLERQFNDLAVLRGQVAKLKEELSIARRVEWIRKGLFTSPEEKGAHQLMTGIKPPPPQTNSRPNYELNVELGTDGSSKIVRPPTNAPPANATPK